MNASSTELRAGAADAIGAAVELTPAAALKPFVIPLTGPLIRIVGDRFPPNVKVAILRALTTLLRKASLALKPFVPQLQSTFVKALADAQSDELRAQGAVALAELAPLSTRVEVLVTDMHGSLSGAVTGVERAYLCALAGVLRKTSKPVSAALLAKVEAAAIERLPSEELGRAAAAAVAACGRWVEDGLPPLLERVEAGVKAAAVADGPWRSDLAELRVHLALLRLQPASTLSPLLPAMLATAVVAAASEESEVRQAAAHALARVASAMAEARSCRRCRRYKRRGNRNPRASRGGRRGADRLRCPCVPGRRRRRRRSPLRAPRDQAPIAGFDPCCSASAPHSVPCRLPWRPRRPTGADRICSTRHSAVSSSSSLRPPSTPQRDSPRRSTRRRARTRPL